MAKSNGNLVAWLKSGHAAEFEGIREYAAKNGWKSVLTLQDAWRNIDKDTQLDPARKQQLRDEAALAFSALYQESNSSGLFRSLNPFGVGVFMFVGSVLGIVALALFEGRIFIGPDGATPLLDALSRADTARGLLSFVFALGVLALALLIVTANITLKDGDDRRFEKSKEILTALIAILATILGFYFGKGDEVTAATEQPLPVEVAAADEVSTAQSPLNTSPANNRIGGTPTP